ncbi:MAG TPA: D-aminoacyl-tRNA deacylase, partial [Thermoplasmata archaeon]|nr:D-aminoacyl-tRNA deacylase [Thermoplasmata archaeon]
MDRPLEYVVVLSADDPVAQALRPVWGTPPALVPGPDGAPIRALAPGVGLLQRPGLHIADDALRVPPHRTGDPPPTLVFPSVHRSAGQRETLTVHPLGNPGPTADVGGRPGALVLTDPRRMTDTLRRAAELAEQIGWPATFEATHHGPALEQPAYFVEIGAADYAHPPEPAVRGFARLLPGIRHDP